MRVRLDTARDVDYNRHGGITQYVMRTLLAEPDQRGSEVRGQRELCAAAARMDRNRRNLNSVRSALLRSCRTPSSAPGRTASTSLPGTDARGTCGWRRGPGCAGDSMAVSALATSASPPGQSGQSGRTARWAAVFAAVGLLGAPLVLIVLMSLGKALPGVVAAADSGLSALFAGVLLVALPLLAAAITTSHAMLATCMHGRTCTREPSSPLNGDVAQLPGTRTAVGKSLPALPGSATRPLIGRHPANDPRRQAATRDDSL